MKANFCALLLIVSILLFCIPAFSQAGGEAAAVNLVKNGDFEDVENDKPRFWSFDAWLFQPDVTKVKSDTEDPYSGSRCVTIENVKTNDARLIQDVEVKPSTVYQLSCFVKATGLPQGKTGANIGILQGISDFSPPHVEETLGLWHKLVYTVKTSSVQKSLRVAIRLGYFNSDLVGKASFDDFRLEEIKDASRLSPVVLETETQQQAASQPAKTSPVGLIILLTVAGILSLGIAAFVIFSLVSGKKARKEKKAQDDRMYDAERADDPNAVDIEPSKLLKKDNAGFNARDIVLVSVMTIAYAVIAFTNLGSNEAPETYWRPVTKGEGCTVDFGTVQNIKRIYYWQGLPQGQNPNESKYMTEGSVDGREWFNIMLLNPKTICWWYYEAVDVSVRYVRLTTEVPGAWLNEVVFLGNDQNNPIKIEKIMPGMRQSLSEGSVDNLFDEYSDVGGKKHRKQLVYRPQIMTGMSPGFDEQYHGRTALEILNFRIPYENTHPPLGKLLIATGILIFGMNPFGWRFMGTLFGVLIIPLMFAFGKRLFKKTEYGFMAAFLMMFDFMHFTQSRIATIDTYPVFFIILTFYFMYEFCEMSYLKTDFKKLLLPLLFSGIAWGFGAASKWTALYAWFGLAIVFFVNLYGKAREVREARASKSFQKRGKEEAEAIQQKIDMFPKRAWQLFGWAVLVFFVIPAFIYSLSYVPTLMARDIHFNLGYIVDNNIGMFRYHSELKATHSYSSRWWDWPIMTKPMAYYFADGLPAGQTQRLFAFGNPAVWWVGSLSMLVLLGFGLVAFMERISGTSRGAARNISFFGLLKLTVRNNRYADSVRFVILTGFMTVYLPWVLSPRQLLFIYHYFPSVPFIIFAIVFLIKAFRDKVLEPMKETNKSYALFRALGNGLVYLYLAIAMILFFMFYPVIAGVPAPTEYIQTWLKWFPNNWYFG